MLLHLIAAMRLGDNVGADLAALASAPFYILWKILLIPSLLRSASTKQEWVRTSRNREEQP
jgi:hypothetical protein